MNCLLTSLVIFVPYLLIPSSQINMKYCCPTALAANFRRELVLENEIRGSLKGP